MDRFDEDEAEEEQLYDSVMCTSPLPMQVHTQMSSNVSAFAQP